MIRSAAAILASAAVFLGAGLCAPAARAHPHMFFDAYAHFLMDDASNLRAVRVFYVIDEFNSLSVLVDLGLDPDGDGALTDDEKRSLASTVTQSLGEWRYFVDLRAGEARQKFEQPSTATAEVVDGRLALTFDLPLATALDAAAGAVSLRLYDPTFYTEVSLLEAPTIRGGGACSAQMSAPEGGDSVDAARQTLAAIDRAGEPEDRTIGVLFAAVSELRCDP